MPSPAKDSKIALDVVLIPPPAVVDLAIRLNRSLTGPGCEEIRLGKEDFIPHISLAMGCARTGSLEDIRKALAEISGRTKPLDLKIEPLSDNENNPKATTLLSITLTDELQTLHETLMRHLEPFLGEDADESAFHGPVKQGAVQWVNSFRDKSAFERYFPHITIGKGNLGTTVEETLFTASRLALCHLGSYCTCRRVLDTLDLS